MIKLSAYPFEKYAPRACPDTACRASKTWEGWTIFNRRRSASTQQHAKAALIRENSTGGHGASPPGTFCAGLLISGLGVRFPRGAL